MSTKSLFITGASSGIGAATARLAVAQGWQVGLFARSKEKLDALAGELGDNAVALQGDVTHLGAPRFLTIFVGTQRSQRLEPRFTQAAALLARP